MSTDQDTIDDIAGEDISLIGGDFGETDSGDLATVTGRDCARQSVFRELPANPGSFPQRQEWGGGLNATLFKSATPTTRDQALARCRVQLDKNPRITRVNDIHWDDLTSDGDPNTTVYVVNADSVGGPITAEVVVRPPGVY